MIMASFINSARESISRRNYKGGTIDRMVNQYGFVCIFLHSVISNSTYQLPTFAMDRWRNKVAVITGASSGIGAEIAKQLVCEGLQVAGIARRSELVEELSENLAGKDGKLYAVKADLSNEEEILAAFEWITENLGPVHILINNAGLMPRSSLIEEETEIWKKTFDINVLGLCIATREAIKIMKENQIDGHIIHINSVAGHSVLRFPGLGVYCASKYAVTALTETLRQELNRNDSKIKITSISPGAVATDLLGPGGFQIAENILAQMPALQVEDIANAILYVLSTPPHVQVNELTIRPVGQTE